MAKFPCASCSSVHPILQDADVLRPLAWDSDMPIDTIQTIEKRFISNKQRPNIIALFVFVTGQQLH